MKKQVLHKLNQIKSKIFTQSIFTFLLIFHTYCFFALQSISAQNNGYLQTELSGGYTSSFRAFSDKMNFAENGLNAGLSMDYFFTRLALGIEGGYFSNSSSSAFTNFIKDRYLDTAPGINAEPWQSKYLLAGPSFKLLKGKVELDLMAKAGVVQTMVPEMEFGKLFSGRYAAIYSITGRKDQWYGAWSGGLRLMARLSNNVGISLKSSLMSTERLNRIIHNHTFSNATDTNGNGVIDDSEYSESGISERQFTTYLTNYNINAGIVIQIGKQKPQEVIQMIPEYMLQSDSTEYDLVEVGPNDTIFDTIPKQHIPETNEEMITINPDDYTATPDITDYDELAANFLYKAGQAYFAANDFENAVACFNKLKADKQYPMAKYMFALSLAEMGNCENSFTEYRDFARNYQGEDAGVLSTVYASHLERCKKPQKQKKSQPEELPVSEKQPSLNYQYDLKAKEVSIKESKKEIHTENKVNETEEKNTTYRIQFIALKKPDYSFPKLYDIGEIRAEFLPEKSMYRYTLGPFYNASIATDVMFKIRKMGFRDAFVAEYANGMRINTLHHSR